ncbi:MAG: hypothetical protein MZU91_05310 [Desulfosudis oleivorans]|nr:hypothetical protein [Desulfosudis oleivorans]
MQGKKRFRRVRAGRSISGQGWRSSCASSAVITLLFYKTGLIHFFLDKHRLTAFINSLGPSPAHRLHPAADRRRLWRRRSQAR